MNKTIFYKRLWLTSLVCTLFIAYPNIAWIRCDLWDMDPSQHPTFLMTFVLRFMYFWALLHAMFRFNDVKLRSESFNTRVVPNVLMALGGFVVYELAIHLFGLCHDRFISTLIFQFTIIAMMSIFIGYISYLDASRKEKEQELNQLKIESLENQCTALTNQINPHFFFNSLNSISSLVRKKDEKKTLDYISQLSFVFRYILQSGRKGLVPLSEELELVDAFRSVMEVRYANKLKFTVNVKEEDMHRMVPVLSLLPLLENVTVHNIIDSDHVMEVKVETTEANELVVSNPVYAKLEKPDTNGTGLRNLQNRFKLLKNVDVRVEKSDDFFKVVLPL